MNRVELVAAMADKAGLAKKDAEKALKALQTGDIELSRRRGISFEKYIWLYDNAEE